MQRNGVELIRNVYYNGIFVVLIGFALIFTGLNVSLGLAQESTELVINGDFASNIDGWGGWTESGPCLTTWSNYGFGRDWERGGGSGRVAGRENNCNTYWYQTVTVPDDIGQATFSFKLSTESFPQGDSQKCDGVNNDRTANGFMGIKSGSGIPSNSVDLQAFTPIIQDGFNEIDQCLVDFRDYTNTVDLTDYRNQEISVYLFINDIWSSDDRQWAWFDDISLSYVPITTTTSSSTTTTLANTTYSSGVTTTTTSSNSTTTTSNVTTTTGLGGSTTTTLSDLNLTSNETTTTTLPFSNTVICGDGICNIVEIQTSGTACVQDCGVICNGDATRVWECSDTGDTTDGTEPVFEEPVYISVCGDGICDLDEGDLSCPEDCALETRVTRETTTTLATTTTTETGEGTLSFIDIIIRAILGLFGL